MPAIHNEHLPFQIFQHVLPCEGPPFVWCTLRQFTRLILNLFKRSGVRDFPHQCFSSKKACYNWSTLTQISFLCTPITYYQWQQELGDTSLQADTFNQVSSAAAASSWLLCMVSSSLSLQLLRLEPGHFRVWSLSGTQCGTTWQVTIWQPVWSRSRWINVRGIEPQSSHKAICDSAYISDLRLSCYTGMNVATSSGYILLYVDQLFSIYGNCFPRLVSAGSCMSS